MVSSCTYMVILGHYVTYLAEMSEQKLPQMILDDAYRWRLRSIVSTVKVSAFCVPELKKHLFRVPRLKKLPEGQHGIHKYRAVKEFISFLVRLLYLETSSVIDSCVDQIRNVEKELRFLLTVLGDTSFMDTQQEFENLLGEFEGVANEAGSFVHSFLFFKVDEGTCVVLNRINLLKANIIKLSDVVPACMSPKTSVVDSFLVLDSLVGDLDDLMNRDDNPIDDDDVKHQFQTIHLGLICLQCFIKDTFLPQPSEIGELKQYYMRIGDLALQAQYIIISFLAGDAPSWYLFNRLIHVNREIELCRFELPEMIMKYKSGGLKVAKYFNKQSSLSLSLSKRNTVVDEDIVGSEEKMRYMLDHLVGGGAELRVISIFGMPGLGKTTLANKLYSHPSVKCRFDRLSWCVVSQTYSRRSILANILIDIASDQLGKDRILKMEEESLAEHIHKTLKGRRYLIVMDDIWDSSVCDELFGCFPNDGNESRVLFTTRNKDVIPPDCIMYALPSLSDGQCWEIIQKKVFENQPCPPELVESGRELAASCQGMPLAAVVIGGILSSVDKEERAWLEVKRNLSSHIVDGGDNSVMRILKLSYDHLPQYLKLCFLYLGVFLKCREIPVRDMMNLWVAQGFIHNENAAEEYLKELINKSLVMVVRRRSDGGPKTCVIHDLLRELCLKTCKEEKLTRFVNSKYFENEEDRHVRIRSSSHQIDIPHMRLQRVLYLDWSFAYLTEIEYLVSLKYLVVPYLPPSIGNLVNLEYLCVYVALRVCLSSTIMKMKKLKKVDVGGAAIYGKDCNTSLTNKLEFLSDVLIRKVKDEKMLRCSPHLRRLKCLYTKRVYGRIDLSFLTRLESLTLAVTKTAFGGVTMSLPPSIKKLTFFGDENKLSRKTMSMLGRLENLEVLKLIDVRFEEKRWDTRDGEFEKLRYLRLYWTDLSRWNVGSSQHFPKLQQLMLGQCFKLGEIPPEIGEIPSMQTIEVDGFLDASARRIQQEQRDMGNEDLRVDSIPSLPLVRMWKNFDDSYS